MAEFIPRVGLPQQQVEQGPQVRNTTRVDDSGGQAIAGALAQGARVVGEYVQQQQEREDASVELAARSQLSELERNFFDPENPDGISKYKGMNALKADQDFLPQIDAKVGELRSTMTPRQQAAFDGIALNFRDGIGARLNGYMDREHTQARDASDVAAIGRITQDAATAGMDGDFARQDELIAEFQAANEMRLGAKGQGGEVLASENRALVSSVRRQTIESFASSNPFKSVELLEQYRGQLTPEDRARVESVVFPVVQDESIRQSVDALFSGSSAVGADDPASIDAAIVQLEYGDGSVYKNPESSASGAGQFIESTWLDLMKRYKPDMVSGKSRAEILDMRRDDALSREMVAAYRQDNTAILQANGVPTTAENLYASHHFGGGGGIKFGRASMDTPMSDILTPGQMNANAYLKGKTKREALEGWQRRGLPVGGTDATPPPASTSQADMLDWVQANVRDPRVRSGMVSEIRSRFAIKDMREAEDKKAYSERVTLALETGDPNQPLPFLIGGEDYARAVRSGDVDALNRIRMNKLQGRFVQDDLQYKEEVQREAVTDIDAFMRRDFNDPKVQARMSTDTLATFKKMQADASKPEKRQQWATESELLSQAYVDLGIRGGGDKNREERDKFDLAFRREVRAYNEAHNGRNPDATQMQTIINGLKVPMVKSTLFGFRETSQEVYRAGAGFNVPAAERVQIIDGLRAAGIASPSEAQVVEAYQRGAGSQL